MILLKSTHERLLHEAVKEAVDAETLRVNAANDLANEIRASIQKQFYIQNEAQVRLTEHVHKVYDPDGSMRARHGISAPDSGSVCDLVIEYLKVIKALYVERKR